MLAAGADAGPCNTTGRRSGQPWEGALVASVLIGALVLAAAVAVHLYVWKRLLADPLRDMRQRGTRWRRIAAGLFLALTALMLAAVFLGTTVAPEPAAWFAWPGYLWMGIGFYLVVGLLLLEPPRLVARLHRSRRARVEPAGQNPGSQNPAGGSSADEKPASDDRAGGPGTAARSSLVGRRALLTRGPPVLVGLTAGVLTGYGFAVATSGPDVVRTSIRLPNLDPRAAGLRIALIADLHLGPLLGSEFTERVARLTAAERPDMVALLGDLVDGDVDELAEAIAPLAELRTRHGSYFVTGNHEYYSGHRQWVDHLDSLGITVLANRCVQIEHDGGLVDLAGINDQAGAQFGDPPDLDAALAGHESDRPVVLLAHRPEGLEAAETAGVDLQLSGHTHGGQIAPFHLAVHAAQGALSGYSRRGRTQLYVTNGAGFWGPPVRVGARPDITIVELQR